MRYGDPESERVIFVSQGLGKEYGSFYRKATSKSVGMHRLKSPALPMVPDRNQAEADLKAYAEKKGWLPID
jgi:hypothetical protein